MSARARVAGIAAAALVTALAAALRLGFAFQVDHAEPVLRRRRAQHGRCRGTTSSSARSSRAASVSIDKPPVDLWLQVASVKLLGFSSTCAEAARGARRASLAVPLLYDLVRAAVRARAPGSAAAAALAVLPIEVITARSDTMDAVMMALIVLAAWLRRRAASQRRSRAGCSWPRAPSLGARLQRQAARGARRAAGARAAVLLVARRAAAPARLRRSRARRAAFVVVALCVAAGRVAVARGATARGRSARPTAAPGTPSSSSTGSTGSAAPRGRRAATRPARPAAPVPPATFGSRSSGPTLRRRARRSAPRAAASRARAPRRGRPRRRGARFGAWLVLGWRCCLARMGTCTPRSSRRDAAVAAIVGIAVARSRASACRPRTRRTRATLRGLHAPVAGAGSWLDRRHRPLGVLALAAPRARGRDGAVLIAPITATLSLRPPTGRLRPARDPSAARSPG